VKGDDPRGPPRWHVAKALLVAARLVAVALIVEFLLLPQLAGTRKSWHLLLDVDRSWLIIALILELGSLLSYSLLTRDLINERGRGPSLWTLTRIDVSTSAVSHVVPAGSAVGLGLGLHLLTQAGVHAGDAAIAKATQAIGSAAVLNLLLLGALVVAVPTHGLSSVFGAVALTAVLLLSFAAAVAVLITRGERRVGPWAGRHLGHIPGVSEQRVLNAVHLTAGHLNRLAGDRRLLARVVTFATMNWLLDAAVLWCCVRAFGHGIGLDGLLVSYGIAEVLAVLPFTPGGLGVVEAFLIPALVGFGVPRGIAILGVLAWRAVSFLLPIPLGLAAYLSLPVTTRYPSTPGPTAGPDDPSYPPGTGAGARQGGGSSASEPQES
jgi:uncharacterized protein (TIRG00374 family)